MKKFLRGIFYFFPFQLFLVHFKRNQILIIFWFFLFGLITKNVLFKLGAYSLFLAPEYFDSVNYWAFFVLGITLGSFIVAFNISSYIVNGPYFPFIATLSRPFFKYTINNFIIPVSFIYIFISDSVKFQHKYEYLNNTDITCNIIALLAGTSFFIAISLSYFFKTNKDIYQMFGIQESNKNIVKPIKKIISNDLQWKKLYSPHENVGKWRIETYMSGFFRIRRARDTGHYSMEAIQSVFRQNHYNSALFAFGVIIIILVFGYFMDNKFFMIPAGASILILCTLFMMFYAAIKSLFKEWSLVAIIIIFAGFHFINKNFFEFKSHTAFGLNYSYKQQRENLEDETYLASFDFQKDYEETIKILNNWKQRNTDPAHPEKRPKMVFLNANGGGMKSMIWTFYSLAYINNKLDDKLLRRTQLITGASGGMIGAAYLRELYLQKQLGTIKSCYNDSIISQLSKDLLNPVMFSFSMHDWFFSFKKFKYNNYSYYIDRAYAFEKKLNNNTYNFLDKQLYQYKKHEQEALIPMMIFTPTIINDGRTLIISPQHTSYLLASDFNKTNNPHVSVEFKRLYKDFGADSIRFLTVLRLNSTFPYVAPIVAMPGKPQFQIMDAGIRDNYGTSTALQFLYAFRDWIKENTGGVIFLNITEESACKNLNTNTDIFQFFKPLGNVYTNIFNIQKMHNDQLAELSGKWMNDNIKFINLYLKGKEERISLSWHLTKKEKEQIIQSIHSPINQKAIDELEKLLQ